MAITPHNITHIHIATSPSIMGTASVPDKSWTILPSPIIHDHIVTRTTITLSHPVATPLVRIFATPSNPLKLTTQHLLSVNASIGQSFSCNTRETHRIDCILDSCQFMLKPVETDTEHTAFVVAKLYKLSAYHYLPDLDDAPLAISNSVSINWIYYECKQRHTNELLVTFEFEGTNRVFLSSESSYVIAVQGKGENYGTESNIAGYSYATRDFESGRFCELKSGDPSWDAVVGQDCYCFVYGNKINTGIAFSEKRCLVTQALPFNKIPQIFEYCRPTLATNRTIIPSNIRHRHIAQPCLVTSREFEPDFEPEILLADIPSVKHQSNIHLSTVNDSHGQLLYFSPEFGSWPQVNMNLDLNISDSSVSSERIVICSNYFVFELKQCKFRLQRNTSKSVGDSYIIARLYKDVHILIDETQPFTQTVICTDDNPIESEPVFLADIPTYPNEADIHFHFKNRPIIYPSTFYLIAIQGFGEGYGSGHNLDWIMVAQGTYSYPLITQTLLRSVTTEVTSLDIFKQAIMTTPTDRAKGIGQTLSRRSNITREHLNDPDDEKPLTTYHTDRVCCSSNRNDLVVPFILTSKSITSTQELHVGIMTTPYSVYTKRIYPYVTQRDIFCTTDWNIDWPTQTKIHIFYNDDWPNRSERNATYVIAEPYITERSITCIGGTVHHHWEDGPDLSPPADYQEDADDGPIYTPPHDHHH